jgi:peptidase M1-like protein/ERAP1-like protein
VRGLALVALVACGHPATPHDPPAGGKLSVPPDRRLPANATPLAYDLRLEVDPDRETFRGHVVIHARLAAPADHVWLHAAELTITSGPPIVARDRDLIALGLGKPTSGDVTLAFDYTGKVGTGEEGLFREFTGGRWYLYAQSEAMFARRIVPCFDEPRFKAAWRVTLVVPGGQIALANGALAAEQRLPDGRRELAFAEVGPMASYLLSIAVGPFALVDAGRAGRANVPVRIVVARDDRTRAQAAAQNVGRVVGALERYVDAPLPLAKLDLVAVPVLFGAMENVGLVTFDSAALVGDRDNPAFVHRFVQYSAHELAHQWFGNAVTPAWWNDLWLAEGFANWLGDKVAAELGAMDDLAVRGAIDRAHALAADDAPAARPLRRRVGGGDDVDETFDAIAYDKAAAVIGMFEHVVGDAKFRDIVREYLGAHAGATATAADFTATLAERAGPELAAAFAQYLERPRVPVVELALRCDVKATVVVHARDDARIPVCVRHPRGETCGIGDLTLPACPAWLVGNAGGRGYYRVAGELLAKPAPPAAVMQPAERLARSDDVASAVARGELPAAQALAELRTLAASKDAIDALAAVAIAAVIDPIVDDATRPAWTSWLAARFRARTAGPLFGGGRSLAERELRDGLIALVPFDTKAIAAARAVVDEVISNGDTAGFDIAIAVVAPADGAPLYERIVAAAAASANDDDRQQRLLNSLAAFGPELAPRLVALVGDARFDPDHVWPAIAAMLSRPATRSAAWAAVRARLPELLKHVVRGKVIAATAGLCDHHAEVAAAFGDDARDPLAAIDRCVARRQKLGALTPQLH